MVGMHYLTGPCHACNLKKGYAKDRLINSSFRPKHSENHESGCLFSTCYRMIRFVLPAGRPPVLQRTMRFCPAYAGITNIELIRYGRLPPFLTPTICYRMHQFHKR